MKKPVSASVNSFSQPIRQIVTMLLASGLVGAGIWLIRGEVWQIMLTNPLWCQPLDVFKETIRSWLYGQDPEGPMQAGTRLREVAVIAGRRVITDSVVDIFEPFHRLDPARGRETGGTGLGLAIVRAAVEACGGGVTATLPVEGGLRVTVRIPKSGGVGGDRH